MTIELVRQGNFGKAMKRISSSRLAPFTEQTHRKLTDLHPPGKAGTTLDERNWNLVPFQSITGKYGMKLINSKCLYRQNSLTFLGHLIAGGPRPDPERLAYYTERKEQCRQVIWLSPAYGNIENGLPVNHANDGDLDREVGAPSIDDTNHMSTHAQSSTDLPQSQE
ncbi:hypothetical protein GJ496_002035 [Pomphorhynchus laevis]|nr:hypothetical protein GJ496_002035 [Pomphorhynchus laevis]